jgi:hypothetical protein
MRPFLDRFLTFSWPFLDRFLSADLSQYEATYYGVYASGHPELAKLYWCEKRPFWAPFYF